MTMLSPPALLVVAVAAALTLTPAHTASCVDVSHGIGGRETVASGAIVRVVPGAIVFVVLVEPAIDTGGGYPASFPWAAASSSDRAVLATAPLCSERRPPASTLPVRVYAFRAERAGEAVLRAPLRPAWMRAPRDPFSGYRAVVRVRSARARRAGAPRCHRRA